MAFPELDGERLDLGVSAMTGLPRRRCRALAEAGRLWLNGKAARVLSRQLRTGDVLDVVAGDLPLAPPREIPAVALLHEDSWLAAIDKPAGVASQPPRTRTPGELTAQERTSILLAHRHGRRVDILLFHRLDRITSGVMLFARSHQAAAALASTWEAGRADKRYLAVVVGAPDRTRWTIDAPIATDRLAAGRFRVDRRGRPSRTEVRVLRELGGLALVEARPLTGRTHQVRVHLAHAGVPVAGDGLYGGGSSAARAFLHAWKLTLPHPEDGSRLELEAPVPADMAAFLAEHGLGSAAG
ncbi:MAG: RluA family pseudouridine synthase [Acidobacteriota bacterium]